MVLLRDGEIEPKQEGRNSRKQENSQLDQAHGPPPKPLQMIPKALEPG
jgi:hypothetical protein